MEYVISASYGNDSMALMQWAHEHGLRVPPDIREVFTMILPDEQRHARMFKDMSTAKDIELMEPYHQAGLQALGLEV